jgi:hypothetical protein
MRVTCLCALVEDQVTCGLLTVGPYTQQYQLAQLGVGHFGVGQRLARSSTGSL